MRITSIVSTVRTCVVFGALIAQPSLAGDLTIPNSFSAGTPALAGEVNSNFTAVEEEVDDNNARLEVLESQEVGADIDLEPLFTNIASGDTSIREVASVSLSAPGAGYVLVTHSGASVHFGAPNTIIVGIGDSNSKFDTELSVGILDASPENSFRTTHAYSVSYLFPVADAKEYTYYGLAQKSTVFDNGSINVAPQSLTAVFFPNRY